MNSINEIISWGRNASADEIKLAIIKLEEIHKEKLLDELYQDDENTPYWQK